MLKLSTTRVESTQFSPAGPRTIGRIFANRNASKKASKDENLCTGILLLRLIALGVGRWRIVAKKVAGRHRRSQGGSRPLLLSSAQRTVSFLELPTYVM